MSADDLATVVSRAHRRRRCPIAKGAGGLISADWCSSVYADVITSLGDRASEETWIRKLTVYTTTHRGKRIDIVFTPFDRVLPNAKVLLVGITPGRHQWRLAVDAARRVGRDGGTPRQMLAAAADTGGFAGPLRTNLISMLDGIGVQRALELDTTAAMFDGRSQLIDGTSAIIHAVFIDGANYDGYRPGFDRVPILNAFVEQVLPANIALVPDALVVPLGKVAKLAVETAVASAGLDHRRVLKGFPHPSGANGRRAENYARLRQSLTRQVRAWRDTVLAQ